MDNNKIIEKYKKESMTIAGYFMPSYDTVMLMLKEAREDEHTKVLQKGYVNPKHIKEIRESEREETLKILTSPAVLEALAYQEHTRWSSWEKYRESIVENRQKSVYPVDTYRIKIEGWKRKREQHIKHPHLKRWGIPYRQRNEDG